MIVALDDTGKQKPVDTCSLLLVASRNQLAVVTMPVPDAAAGGC